MSGPSDRAYFSFRHPAGRPEHLSPVDLRKRLAAAIVLSFLLHAVVLLMPSPGTGERAVQAGAPVLDVRLEQGKLPATRLDIPPVAPTAIASVPPVTPSEPAGVAQRPSRGLDLLPVPAAPYFTSDRLSRPPVPTSEPLVFIPRKTAQFVTGRVTLKVWINELGGVDEVEVERSDVPAAVSALAAAAFRRLHFVPGQVDGRSVGVLLRLEIAFMDGQMVTQ
jgi:TonB family protein